MEFEIVYDYLIVFCSWMMLDFGGEFVNDWMIQFVGICLQNFNYNIVKEEVLKFWLVDLECVLLVVGFYLDIDVLVFKLVLKLEIQFIIVDQECICSKSLFWNILLGVVNIWVWYQCSCNFKCWFWKYYYCFFMVFEGDFWFQYLAIMEIIDYLSLSYNIYSWGVVGDEM